MKKLLYGILSIYLLLLSSCNSNNKEQESKERVEYISHFDTYDEASALALFYSGPDSVSYPYHEYGAARLNWQESNYVSEGNHSLKVEVLKTNHFKTRLYSNNYVSKVTSLENAKSISIDVYNPNEFEIEFELSANSTSMTLLKQKETCKAISWTTISYELEDEIDLPVYAYYLYMENNETNVPFTLYIDNFYVTYNN